VLEDIFHLRSLDAWEPLKEVIYASAVLKILEECEDGNSGSTEYPCAANPLWVVLYRQTGAPLTHTSSLRAAMTYSSTIFTAEVCSLALAFIGSVVVVTWACALMRSDQYRPRQDQMRLVSKIVTGRIRTKPELRRIKSHFVGIWGRLDMMSKAMSQ
jgi:hypothetical protein